jgi:hypothetical protein
MYFKARNGTYKRIPQSDNFGFEGSRGGMTIYYMQDPIADVQQKSKVTSFKPVGIRSQGTNFYLIYLLGIPHACGK